MQHRPEAGGVGFHHITVALACLLFTQAHHAQRRMRKHHRSDIVVIQPGLCIAAEQAVHQAACSSNRDGGQGRSRGDVTHCMHVRKSCRLHLIDHDMALGIKRHIQGLQAQ